ncbi:DUF2075 domain-containing protein [Dasania marina]|uniref:DUF2075 domain-containing protein n=1 Tax=Dasania marina TaxID=471499 RepID=UPI000360A114|nr:DUF2075 domain-containing protein [Dasania marina]
MNRAYYKNTIASFCTDDQDHIMGKMVVEHHFALLGTQRDAWVEQILLLQSILSTFSGHIYFEYSIPRMGKRIDVLLIIGGVIFVVEFKVGASSFLGADLDQVTDYALDLRNFHEGSHDAYIAPILVSTDFKGDPGTDLTQPRDKLFSPICCNGAKLEQVISRVLALITGTSLDTAYWESSGYKPTPTIIEATLALYNGHSVVDISRSDAGAINLSKTSESVAKIIKYSRANNEKAIIFVTGVPGAGKTLVGLNVATAHIDKDDELYSVFLSGNGPLVSILQEALARDKVERSKDKGEKIRIGEARSEVKAFIQNVHHFRDDGLANLEQAPIEHVALFDEAQRAWDKKQTVDFMRMKKGQPNFNQSEPEFLISCMDRHRDWAVVVCLVGGGQEINKGEAGIFGWSQAVKESFPDWKIYASDQLSDSEYGGETTIEDLRSIKGSTFIPQLHLKSSMRSFRSENVSLFVKQLLDLELSQAQDTFKEISENYPIVLTRNLETGREWLREQARGSERYGIVVSSQAERLRPLGVHVKAPVNPVNWFLDGKDHVRSSYYLEDVATEFHVQGLELDWACLVWDADFRYTPEGWNNFSFRGNKWQRIKKEERQIYQKNAYRVLLTRARQGMVVVVPEGDDNDLTRPRSYYDDTYRYLEEVGLKVV